MEKLNHFLLLLLCSSALWTTNGDGSNFGAFIVDAFGVKPIALSLHLERIRSPTILFRHGGDYEQMDSNYVVREDLEVGRCNDNGLGLPNTENDEYQGGDQEDLFSDVTDLCEGDSDPQSSNPICSPYDDEQWDVPRPVDSEEDSLREEYEAWSRALDKALRSSLKKERSLRQELEKAEKVEETQARAQLLTANLYQFTSGQKRVTAVDWENGGQDVVLEVSEKFSSAAEEAEALFNEARKLKRGAKVVSELLLSCRESLAVLRNAELDLKEAQSVNEQIDSLQLLAVQDRLRKTSNVTDFRIPQEAKAASTPETRPGSKPRSIMDTSVRKLRTPAGSLVFVGRNQRGNEFLSMQFAKGADVWLHARSTPGAHVVIQNRRGSPPVTDECVEFAANLAVFYSDARNEAKFGVSVAEPKHVLKPRGAPLGAVKLRMEKEVLLGFPDRVPAFLKEAREESGQSDEYRTLDKSKHRKRTREAARESQQKRRAEARKKTRRNRIERDD